MRGRLDVAVGTETFTARDLIHCAIGGSLAPILGPASALGAALAIAATIAMVVIGRPRKDGSQIRILQNQAAAQLYVLGRVLIKCGVIRCAYFLSTPASIAHLPCVGA